MAYISFVSPDMLELASKNPIGDLTISKFITYIDIRLACWTIGIREKKLEQTD
jgi:hypothetical protein